MPGGDCIALDATMDALRRKGVECVETGWDSKAITDGQFDLCHIFHCNFSWSYGNYEAVKRSWKSGRLDGGNAPYVLTPIYYPGLLSGITDDQLEEIVFDAALVLPFSNREAMELREAVGYFPYEAIPNGTDPAFHCATPASERKGVLCVSARGTEDKGIPMVRAACEKLGIPFTAVTGVPHSELPAIYAKHRVFVNASDSERMSLTTLEALCSGCNVLSRWAGPGSKPADRGWEWTMPKLVDVGNLSDLCLQIETAYRSESHSWERSQERARALTWDLVADRLIDVYRWVIR